MSIKNKSLIFEFRSVLNSDFIITKLPSLAKYFSKYGSLLADAKSLVHYYILRTKTERKPSLVPFTIMPTTVCNGNCTFCAYRHFKDKKENMPLDLFKKVVDDFKKNGGSLVDITPAQGDILTDPAILDKIRYMNKADISCTFFTNAILLKQKIDDIVDLKIKEMHIDVGDIVPEYDSKVFQIPLSSSENRLKAILELLNKAKKKKSKTKFTLEFRPMRSPSKIFKDLKKSDFWEYYKDGFLSIGFLQAYDNWGGSVTGKDLIGVQTLKVPALIRKFPCVHFYQLSILPNGDARICGCRCLKTFKDELVVGNINKNNIKEILDSDKWRDLISNFEKGKIPKVCRKCSFYRPQIE